MQGCQRDSGVMQGGGPRYNGGHVRGRATEPPPWSGGHVGDAMPAGPAGQPVLKTMLVTGIAWMVACCTAALAGLLLVAAHCNCMVPPKIVSPSNVNSPSAVKTLPDVLVLIVVS